MSTQNHRVTGAPQRACVTSHLTNQGMTTDPLDERRISGEAEKPPVKSGAGKSTKTIGDKI